jgi:hypothetical protein
MVPEGQGLIAVLEAYFDESRQRGQFCVVGHLYRPDQARRFRQRWLTRMHGRTFHATDAAACEGDFKGFTTDQIEALWPRLLRIIVDCTSLTIGVHFNLDELRQYQPQAVKLEKFAYVIGAISCINKVSRWVDHRMPTQRVSYFFDQGHQGEAAAGRIIDAFIAHRASRKGFKYRNHSFLESSESPLLQGADLLAWELCKGLVAYYGERENYREAIRILLGAKENRYAIGELTGQTLKRAVEIYRAAWAYALEGVRQARPSTGAKPAPRASTAGSLRPTREPRSS